MLSPRNSTQIRCNNIRTLLAAIKANGPVAKRELQKLTGLSWGAVSSLTGLLCEHGYIVSAGKQVTSVGRKPSELDINGDDHYIVGVDLNLSGLCGVITDMKGRIIREWLRLFARNEYDCILDTLLALLDEIFAAFSHKLILGIGLAVQGFVDMENGVSVYLPHVQGWKDVPLRRMMEERYGCSTLVLHDPNCIMVAEKAFGDSFMGIAENAVLVRIDNGIGMAQMVNGQLYLGANGRAGELEHVVVNTNGPVCACGNRGCLNAYATGGGLVRQFDEKVRQGCPTIADTRQVREQGYKILAAAAQNGDVLCRELFEQMGVYLGQALSTVYNLLNPDLIVLYGDLTAYRELFAEAVQRQLEAHVYKGIPAKLQFSALGRNAAAQGAALVVSDQKVAELDLPVDSMEE